MVDAYPVGTIIRWADSSAGGMIKEGAITSFKATGNADNPYEYTVGSSTVQHRDIIAVITPESLYPKTISGELWSFVVSDATEEKYIKNFLGIDPPGPGVSDYLESLTLAQLDAWRADWLGLAKTVDVPGWIDVIEERYFFFLARKGGTTTTTEPAPTPTPATAGVVVTGTVTDKLTFLPIQNAGVTIGLKAAATDSIGKYAITDPSPLANTIRAFAAGYNALEVPLEINPTGETVTNFALTKSTAATSQITELPPLRYDLPSYFAQAFPQNMRMLEPGSPPERNELKERAAAFVDYSKAGVDAAFDQFKQTHSPVSPEDSVAWVASIAAGAGTTWALSMAASTLAEAVGFGQIETVSDWLQSGFVQLGLGAMMGVPLADTYNIALRTPFNSFLRKEYRTTIPPISDQVRFTVREAWTKARQAWIETLPEDEKAEELKEQGTLSSIFYGALKSNAAYLGFTDNDIESYWHAHWQLPNISQLFDMRHRDIIDDSTLTRMLIANDYHPAWIERLKRITFEIPRLVDLRTGFEFGALTEDQYRANLLKRGYEPSDIDWVVQAGKNTILRDDFNRVRTQLVNQFVEGYILVTTLESELDALGINPAVRDMNVREAQLKRDVDQRKAVEDALLDRFEKGIDDETTTRANLETVVVDADVLTFKIELRKLRQKPAAVTV